VLIQNPILLSKTQVIYETEIEVLRGGAEGGLSGSVNNGDGGGDSLNPAAAEAGGRLMGGGMAVLASCAVAVGAVVEGVGCIVGLGLC